MSNFRFLEQEYPELFRLAELSETLLYVDSSATLVKLRTITEKAVLIIAEYEGFLDELKDKDFNFRKLYNSVITNG